VATIGVLMTCDEGQTLNGRWEYVSSIARRMRPHWKLGQTYQGFKAALVQKSGRIQSSLAEHLRQQMRKLAGPAGVD
jgi:hypothetical protein